MPRYVLHHVAQGQDWPEGDATFHRRILAPTLLVHGLQDPFVTLVQECEMERVSRQWTEESWPDTVCLFQEMVTFHYKCLLSCTECKAGSRHSKLCTWFASGHCEVQ